MGKIIEGESYIILELHVKPNSKESKLVIQDEAIILYINATPMKGKANKELLQFMSKYFGLARNQIKIVAGTKSKTKTIRLSDLNQEQKKKIAQLIEP